VIFKVHLTHIQLKKRELWRTGQTGQYRIIIVGRISLRKRFIKKIRFSATDVTPVLLMPITPIFLKSAGLLIILKVLDFAVGMRYNPLSETSRQVFEILSESQQMSEINIFTVQCKIKRKGNLWKQKI